MADDVKEILISRIRCTKFALQMDESTDVAGLAVLMVFVCYIYLQSYQEDLLLCSPLPTNTTGSEIFNLLDDFFSSNEIPWENCADVCTDGAKAMTGHNSGAIAKIKDKAKKCSSSHCILHRHALVSRKMPSELMIVLNDAIKIINYIKSQPLKSRLFKLMCEDMGSHHVSLLLHTEIRWLSRGKALTRLMELRAEVAAFLMDHNALLATLLNDEDWVCKLAYLTDIFNKMNEMDLSLQGKTATVFDANAKMSSFKRKLTYWLECVEKEDIDCFPLTKSFLNENNIEIPEKIQKNIQAHLEALKDSFEHYFPTAQEKVLDDFKWVLNVFSVSKKPPSLNSAEYEVLIDLTSYSELKIAFQNQSLPEFWLNLHDEFKILSEKAKLVLLPFSTTYLCEAGFSAYTSTKTKYRSRLNAEPDIRLQLSTIEPTIRKLCKKMQPQGSH